MKIINVKEKSKLNKDDMIIYDGENWIIQNKISIEGSLNNKLNKTEKKFEELNNTTTQKLNEFNDIVLGLVKTINQLQYDIKILKGEE